MGNDKIVHFVGFATTLCYSEFTPIWESYLRKSNSLSSKVILDEAESGQKGVFQYMSQHECNLEDFKFAFMKDGARSSFPERKARVVQLGGYSLVLQQSTERLDKESVKIIILIPFGQACPEFLLHSERDQLNIYEAYFENCRYNQIVELLIQKDQLPAFLIELNEKHPLEYCVYKECFNSLSFVMRSDHIWQ